jgi:hypothetical protein
MFHQKLLTLLMIGFNKWKAISESESDVHTQKMCIVSCERGSDNKYKRWTYKRTTVFARSNTGIVSSNQTQGIYVWIYSVSIGSGLATSWSPVRGALLPVLGIRNWSRTKSFTDALCSKLEATEKRVCVCVCEREREKERERESVFTEKSVGRCAEDRK